MAPIVTARAPALHPGAASRSLPPDGFPESH